MKKIFAGILTCIAIVSCQDKITERYKIQVPQYLSYDDLRQSVKVESAAQELENPGKIYFWNNYIFVNEPNKGIHIINNADPANPTMIKFISIPGNVDISIKDGILYADSYIDLVALDINNLDHIFEVARLDSIFPYTLPMPEKGYSMAQVDRSKGVVIGYKEEYTEVDHYKPETRYYPYYTSERMDFNMLKVSASSSSGGATSGIGVGGSMARFTIAENNLYAINNNSQLLVFDIKTVKTPIKVGELTVSWGIETLFPYNGKLFIGSQTGMIIYSLANPNQPQFISNYQHIRSCDPVVVDGNYAYVTLRTGTTCFGTENRLDIVDISNIENPKEVKTYNMTNPHGLGIDGNTLFLCDGDAGLKIFDVTEKTKVNENMIVQYPGFKAFDVIPINGVLLSISDSGLFQYDYKNLADIKLLSKIKVK